ncbi:hypothetical protein [Haloferula sp. BvORR071]|uniref:hypothetical protein n=1 Tax=Haloferula sp. BvORR071 TaxID=1396141 RepID=UPI000555E47B|nr:hypothetical protein [Haloferula sp. BvORR071]
MRQLLALLIALLPLASFAQEKSKRTCRVLVLGENNSVPSPLYLYDGKVARQIDLPRMNLSKFYELPGGALTLRLLKAPLADKEVPDPASPSATVGENIGACYLMLSADPSNKTLPVRLQVIDASAEHFKPGQMLWYNLTGVEIGGQVGKQQVAVKPRSKVIVDAPTSGHEDYNVNLSYRTSEKSPAYPVCETRWNHDPSARTILFIVAEPGSPIPRVMSFPDNPEPEGKNP